MHSGQPIPDGIDDGERCVMLIIVSFSSSVFVLMFCLETWVDKNGGGASPGVAAPAKHFSGMMHKGW